MIGRILDAKTTVACGTNLWISVAAAYLAKSAADDAPPSRRWLPEYDSVVKLLLPKKFA